MPQATSLHKSGTSLPNGPAIAPHRVVRLLIGATIEEIERELIVQTLIRCSGNRTQAALILGMSIRTLRNKIRQYCAHGIDVPAHH